MNTHARFLETRYLILSLCNPWLKGGGEREGERGRERKREREREVEREERGRERGERVNVAGVHVGTSCSGHRALFCHPESKYVQQSHAKSTFNYRSLLFHLHTLPE